MNAVYVVNPAPDYLGQEVEEQAFLERWRTALRAKLVAARELVAELPTPPVIWLTPEGDFGGFAEPHCAISCFYARLLALASRRYNWLFRPHDGKFVDGFCVDEQFAKEQAVAEMSRVWFDAAVQRLVDAGLVKVVNGGQVLTEPFSLLYQLDSQFNADGSINEAHEDVEQVRKKQKKTQAALKKANLITTGRSKAVEAVEVARANLAAALRREREVAHG
jgi:hypothetical protein